MLFPIEDIGLGCFVEGGIQEDSFYNVLDRFHLGRGIKTHLVAQGQDPKRHFLCLFFTEFTRGLSRLCDGSGNFHRIKGHNPSVTLFDSLEHKRHLYNRIQVMLD